MRGGFLLKGERIQSQPLDLRWMDKIIRGLNEACNHFKKSGAPLKKGINLRLPSRSALISHPTSY